jgi:ribosomal protein S18 acetylase RimI-like enzyme
MASQFLLRRARDTDSVALSQLGKQTFRETYIEDLAIPLPQSDIESHFRSTKTREYYASKIADPLRAMWVVEDKTNDELVAFIIACPCALPHPQASQREDGEIEFLYVRRDERSLGLGQQLMNVALLWLEERFKGRPVWLATLSCNLKAQKFYKHYGFIQVGDYYSNVGLWKQHEVIMRRENHLT